MIDATVLLRRHGACRFPFWGTGNTTRTRGTQPQCDFGALPHSLNDIGHDADARDANPLAPMESS
jgi:hypothetical protein